MVEKWGQNTDPALALKPLHTIWLICHFYLSELGKALGSLKHGMLHLRPCNVTWDQVPLTQIILQMFHCALIQLFTVIQFKIKHGGHHRANFCIFVWKTIGSAAEVFAYDACLDRLSELVQIRDNYLSWPSRGQCFLDAGPDDPGKTASLVCVWCLKYWPTLQFSHLKYVLWWVTDLLLCLWYCYTVKKQHTMQCKIQNTGIFVTKIISPIFRVTQHDFFVSSRMTKC